MSIKYDSIRDLGAAFCITRNKINELKKASESAVGKELYDNVAEFEMYIYTDLLELLEFEAIQFIDNNTDHFKKINKGEL